MFSPSAEHVLSTIMKGHIASVETHATSGAASGADVDTHTMGGADVDTHAMR
jgi:hypothetical protein